MERHGRGEYLPAFCCAANLWIDKPVKHPDRDGSGVLLVWFQDTLEPVLGDYIRREAGSVLWAQVASDFDDELSEAGIEEGEFPRVPRCQKGDLG
jgi:hypothetical protein